MGSRCYIRLGSELAGPGAVAVEQALGTRVLAILGNETQQLGVSARTVAQGCITQPLRQAHFLAGLQQSLVSSAQVVGAFMRLVKAQVQVSQVVVGDDECSHRFVHVMPALEQHLGQRQGLQVVFPGVHQFALFE